MGAAICQFLRRQRDRNPESDVAVHKLKASGHHSNDREFLAVEQEFAPNDVALAAVALLPQTMVEHDNLVGSRALVRGLKPTAQFWLDPEHRKQICIYRLRLNALWFTVAYEVKGLIFKCRHLRKNAVLRFPICIVRRRRRVARESREGSIFPNHYQLVRLVKRECSQQNGVDQAKDCGVRANAERQRQDCHGREAGMLQQASTAIANVVDY